MNVLYHHRTRGREVEGVHIRGVVGALRARGHRVDVVSPPAVDVEAEAPPGGGRPARATPSPWRLLSRRAPELLFEAAEVAYNAWAWPRLAALLARDDYRLVYDRYALFSFAAVMAARRRGVPLILEVNDSAALDRIRPLALRAAARRVERFIWTSADAIVTVSGYFRDLIIETGARPEAVHVIPNAVDDAAFARLPDGAAARRDLGLGGKTVVGYVGALNQWRRLDLLVAAFAALAPRHPDAHLLVVGDGPDRAALEAELLRRGLAARATFTGSVAHAEVPRCLAAIDIAVIPHSNDYGSPMKLFECMAAGKAVVAPWLPPIVSVIGDDDGGILFAPLDGGALAAALDGLLADPARRARVGARAREKALGRYAWRRHADTLLAIHAALAGGRR